MQTDMLVRRVTPPKGLAHDPSRWQARVRLWSLPGPTAPERTVKLSAAKDAEVPGGVQSWVHLAMLGTWAGHQAGKVSFDRAIFEQLIRNFDSLANPTPWTIGHPDGATPAPGWVQQLAIVGDGSDEHDGLYALTAWTADTAAEIKRGGWKYCSVYVDFESRDRMTNEPIGCELIQVGLTNNPFLDGQKPIMCDRIGPYRTPAPKPQESTMTTFKFKKQGPAEVAQEQLDAIASELGMDSADPDKIKARVDALVALVAAMTDPVAPDAPAADAAMSDAFRKRVIALGKMLKRTSTAKLARIAKLAGPDAPPPSTSPEAAEGEGEEAAEGALLDSLMAIIAKAGLDPVAGKAALDANADAIATLLQGGGVPQVSADAMPPAMMQRQLTAAQRSEAELKSRIAKLEADATARAEADAKAVKAAADAAEAKRLADEKAAKDVKLAAEKAEADALIADGIKTGKLLLATARDAAGKLVKTESGSEVETWREMFAANHETAKKALERKRGVPVDPLTAGAHPVPPVVPQTEQKFSILDKDLTEDERRLKLMNRSKGEQFIRNAIALHRSRFADAG